MLRRVAGGVRGYCHFCFTQDPDLLDQLPHEVAGLAHVPLHRQTVKGGWIPSPWSIYFRKFVGPEPESLIY